MLTKKTFSFQIISDFKVVCAQILLLYQALSLNELYLKSKQIKTAKLSQ